MTPNGTSCLAWQNVHHTVSQFAPWPALLQRKCLLSSVSGTFARATLNGLMGPSGSGKTTLLNCLAGKTALSGDGSLLVNRQRPSVVSYLIEQHVGETMLSSFTLRETLQYAFRFKNKSNSAAMSEHIDAIMSQLMLSPELSGRAVSQLSGGQLKRLAIAQELMSLSRPDFLFVDEATTGLDSSAALQMMACLQKLTQGDHPMTIVVSIHVPNQEILHLFDKLYVLARGGLAIYSGPPGYIRMYLRQSNVNVSVPEDTLPIETLIELACREDSPVVQTLAANCSDAECQSIARQASHLRPLPFGLPNHRQCFTFSHFFLQLSRFFTLIFLNDWRAFLTQATIYALVSLLFACMFDWKMIHPTGCLPLTSEGNGTCFTQLDKTSLFNENVNFLNLSLYNALFIIITTACVGLSSVAKILRTEHQNKWYSLGTFYLSFTILSSLQLAIYVLIIAGLNYFATGQFLADLPSGVTLNWTRLGHYTLCLLLFSLFGQSLGQLLGVLCLNSTITGLISSIVTCSLVELMSDFYFQTGDINLQLFVSLAECLGVKYLIRYLVFIFYGIDRCTETEFSYILRSYAAENGDEVLKLYGARMITNTVLLRCTAFLLLYCKFSHPFQGFRRTVCKLIPKGSVIPKGESNGAISKDDEPMISTCCRLAPETEPLSQPQSLFLAWRNLSLYGSTSFLVANSASKHGTTILRQVSGQLHFGTLTALMGPSGAGKTSLLRVLNGQFKDRLSMETRLFLSKSVRTRSCFLTQEVADHLWPGLTAKQALIFASKLKNGTVKGAVDHEAIASRLLDELDLTGTADTKLESCSGGERKRLALAQELTALAMPNLVCIDEPTSGLDSTSAEAVIACLRSLASRHRLAIVASVHQPNSRLLRHFNSLYVLAQGGVAIYSGPPNGVQSALSQIGETLSDIDGNQSSTESLIAFACLGHSHSTVQTLSRRCSAQLTASSATLHLDCHLVPDGIGRTSLRFSLRTSFLLFRRYFLYYFTSQLHVYLLFSLFLLGFCQSLVFMWHFHKHTDHFLDPFCVNLAEDDTSTTSNLTDCSASTQARIEQTTILTVSSTLTYFIYSFFPFLLSIQSGITFYSELARFRNEHRNGWYSLGSFYLSKSAFETVASLPLTCLYFYVGTLLEPVRPGMYAYSVALMSFSLWAHQGMTHLIVVLVGPGGSPLLQYTLQMSTQICLAYLSNFFSPLTHLHTVYQWVSNFSLIRFTFEAVALLAYGFGRCAAEREIQPILYWMDIQSDAYFVTCLTMILANLLLYRVLTIWLLLRQLDPTEKPRHREGELSNYGENLKPSNAIIQGMSSSV